MLAHCAARLLCKISTCQRLCSLRSAYRSRSKLTYRKTCQYCRWTAVVDAFVTTVTQRRISTGIAGILRAGEFCCDRRHLLLHEWRTTQSQSSNIQSDSPTAFDPKTALPSIQTLDHNQTLNSSDMTEKDGNLYVAGESVMSRIIA